MSEPTNTGIVKKSDSAEMSYVPFGAADKIKLTVDIIKNLVAVPSRSGKTCSTRDALKFMALCQAQRLNPFAGDAFLIGYDNQDGTTTFSMITAHAAFLKRAESSPDYEGMDSGIILADEDSKITEREGDFYLPKENVVGGWARVFRKGRHPTYRRTRMDRFNKGFAEWKKDAAGMICKCAEADALRSTFPTLLGGLYTHGEIIEITAEKQTFEPRHSQLVETVPAPSLSSQAESEPRPEAEPEKPAPPEHPTSGDNARNELSNIVTGGGFTFDTYRRWVIETGQNDEADSWAGFEDVPEGLARRLIRAKIGLLKGLAEVKKAESSS